MIELLTEAGQVEAAHKIFNAWVTAFTAMPDLDANANTVAFQTITLQHEGWQML